MNVTEYENVFKMHGCVTERKTGTLYDRLRVSGGTKLRRDFKLFTEPVNERRTFLDTNMLSYGRLNPPHGMIVQRVLFLFQPSVTEQDRNSFLASYHWELHVLNKVLFREPTLRAAAIGKPEDLIPNFGKPNVEGVDSQLGLIAPAACWSLGADPVCLAPLMDFYLQLIADDGPWIKSDFDMYVMLEGLRDYGVQ